MINLLRSVGISVLFLKTSSAAINVSHYKWAQCGCPVSSYRTLKLKTICAWLLEAVERPSDIVRLRQADWDIREKAHGLWLKFLQDSSEFISDQAKRCSRCYVERYMFRALTFPSNYLFQSHLHIRFSPPLSLPKRIFVSVSAQLKCSLPARREQLSLGTLWEQRVTKAELLVYSGFLCR